MRRALNAAVLALTALALLATSKTFHRSCSSGPLVPGPTTLWVETTCGPAGTVTATLDPVGCRVTLEDAAAVGLPSSGSLDEGTLTLADPDASRHCRCEENAAGEWTVRCYVLHDPDALGCGGSNLPACSGVLRTVVVPASP